MSQFHGFAMTGGIHSCYSSWMKFQDCYSTENEPVVMCRDEFDDYYECFHGEKQKKFQMRVMQELHKWKVLAIPKYNELTDAFEPVTIPDNPDEYFK